MPWKECDVVEERLRFIAPPARRREDGGPSESRTTHRARLTTETSPTLREGFGVGTHTAAELLILFGDHPDRIRSDAAFATLCGACPIPASSGRTTGRHRRPRSSRHRPQAIPPTNPRRRRPTHRRGPDHTRDHPMPSTLPCARDLPTRHDRLPHTPSRHPGRFKRVS